MQTPRTVETVRTSTIWGELVLKLQKTGSRSAERRDPESGPPERSISAILMLDGMFLMDSTACVSELALARRGLELAGAELAGAELAGAELAGAEPTRKMRVLVGGLGLGLTLRELLHSDQVGHVTVVELFAELVQWNHVYLAPLNEDALNDPRVICQVGDLLDYLGVTKSSSHEPADAELFDLMLLDIDNGPNWLSLPSNAALYSAEGLCTIRRHLTQKGVALFWATEKSRHFETLLSQQQVCWHKERVDWCLEHLDMPFEDVLYVVRNLD